MESVTATIDKVSNNQQAIAASVEQQTSAINEIGRTAVSIDDGPEVVIDQFGSRRECVMHYESPELAHGPHTVRLRVTGDHNPESRYIWVALEHL